MIWNNELAEESSSAPAYKLRLPDATLTSVEIPETAYLAPDPGGHQLSSGIVKAKRARTHTAGRLGLSILAAVVGHHPHFTRERIATAKACRRARRRCAPRFRDRARSSPAPARCRGGAACSGRIVLDLRWRHGVQLRRASRADLPWTTRAQAGSSGVAPRRNGTLEAQ